MYKNTIAKIETIVNNNKSIEADQKAKLLKLTKELENELATLTTDHSEDAESISNFAQTSTHEALRVDSVPGLLTISIEGFRQSVTRFEVQHPNVTLVVNKFCDYLANLGI